MPNPETTEPSTDEIRGEVEAARKHLYTALGSITILTGYMPDFPLISGHIKEALSMLPKRGETNDAPPKTTDRSLIVSEGGPEAVTAPSLSWQERIDAYSRRHRHLVLRRERQAGHALQGHVR